MDVYEKKGRETDALTNCTCCRLHSVSLFVRLYPSPCLSLLLACLQADVLDAMKAGLTDAYEQIEERDERIVRMHRLLDAAAQRLRSYLEEVHPNVSRHSGWRGDQGETQGGQSTSAGGPCQPGCLHEAAAMRRLGQELRAAKEASEKEVDALKAELVGESIRAA